MIYFYNKPFVADYSTDIYSFFKVDNESGIHGKDNYLYPYTTTISYHDTHYAYFNTGLSKN